MPEPHLIEIVGDQEGQHEAERGADDEVQEGVLERDPEDRIFQDAPEILQADEAGRGQQVPLGKRDAERLHGRIEPDHPKKEERNRKEDPGVDRLLGLDGALVERSA